MLRMAVLVSGGGTNLQAIIDSIGNGTVTNAEIAVVISNNRSAYALERAKQNGIDAAVVSPKDYETREAFNRALLEKIQSYLANQLDISPDDITRDTTFESLGIDSLDTVEMVMDLEEQLGVDLELEEKLTTVGELVEFVASKLD